MKKFLRIILVIFFSLPVFSFLYSQNSQTPEEKEKFICQELFTLPWGNQEGEVGLFNGPDRFYGPRSMEIDEKAQRIFILDSENYRVAILNFSGQPIYSFPINEREDDLLLTKNQTLLTLNTSDNSVKEYNFKGQVLAQHLFARPGSPVTGINIVNGYPAIETADQRTLISSLNEKELRIKLNEPEMRKTLYGKTIDKKNYLVERQSPQKGILKIYLSNTTLEKEIFILPQEGNIETLKLLGLDSLKNIYLVVEESINPGWKIKRFLKKLTPDGRLLAQTVIPYSNYAYKFKDLKVSPSGNVYQMLPLEKGLSILVWFIAPAGSEDINEGLNYLSSLFQNYEVSRELTTLSTYSKELSNYDISISAITPDNILYRAQQYANLTFYVNSNNIAPVGGVSCGGKTIETYVRNPGTYIGVLYKWGGFSGITGVTSYTDCGYNFIEGLNAGLYAGDVNTNTTYGSCCAVGVDCSGFVSQCWGLSSKYGTSTLPNVSFLLYSNDFLEQGDALNNPSSHVMLFYRRETDGRFTVYESSANDWKVSSRSYYASTISNYGPYRYIQYSAPSKFNLNTRVQIVTSESLPVRSSYSRSATQLYTVSYPSSGTVIDGPIENEGYLWVKVQWDGQSTSGWCNSAPLAKIQTQNFTISGYVRTSSSTGISGVVMNGLPGNPSTDANGYYSGSVPYGWSGTVTPTKAGYSFSPASTTYTNVTSNQTTNYTGSLDTNAYPPKNPKLQRLINNYIFFKEYINRLSWETNEQNVVPVIKYRIYAKVKGSGDENFRLLTEVPASALFYDHRYLKMDEYYSYRITAVNQNQQESNYVEISN